MWRLAPEPIAGPAAHRPAKVRAPFSRAALALQPALTQGNLQVVSLLGERHVVVGSLPGTLCLLHTLADDVWETRPLRVIQ